MQIEFSKDAGVAFQAAMSGLREVQGLVTPVGGFPFRVQILGVDFEADTLDAVKVARIDLDGFRDSPPETVRVETFQVF